MYVDRNLKWYFEQCTINTRTKILPVPPPRTYGTFIDIIVCYVVKATTMYLHI